MTERRSIQVDYLARVEGEGSLDVRIADGKVEDVRLAILEHLQREVGHVADLDASSGLDLEDVEFAAALPQHDVGPRGDLVGRERRPEEHRGVLGREVFDDCLGVIDPASLPSHRYIKSPPQADCGVKGRPVYRVSVTPAGRELGYDRRIVWIDSETFADYRSEYYRDGQLIKTIDKSWRGMGLDDPRAQYWLYWYARTHASGQEGMAYAARDAVQWNSDLDPQLWSERTLRRIKR